MTAHVSTFAYVFGLKRYTIQPSWPKVLPNRIAGGETVSTFLAGTTCFLLQHPEKLNRLVSEIRGAFSSYEEINSKSAQQLSYLQAVINEGLRIFPPGSMGSPRVSPGFELHGRYIPAGVRIPSFVRESWRLTMGLYIYIGRHLHQPVDGCPQSPLFHKSDGI